ncbi:MAG: Fur family transcriptional regulator [Coriobacteriales bacterium]|jgi:Fe2+ or Zn2+ uptake regulation protein
MTQRRHTRQRQMVYDAVQELSGCHPTANEVYAQVHQYDGKVSLGTVYRNLKLLADSGDILAINYAGGCHFDQRTDAHPHIVCVKCGSMDDAMVEDDLGTDAKVAEATGYSAVTHSIVYEGVCPDCQKEEASA